MDHKKILCPACQSEIEIPLYVLTLNCPTCGENIDLEKQKNITEADPDDVLELIAEKNQIALDGIPDEILFKRDIGKNFNRERYTLLFTQYTDRIRPSIEALNEAFLYTVNQKDKVLTDFAEAISERIIRLAKANTKGSYTFSEALMDARFLVSAFFVPAIIEQCLEISDPLSDAIIGYWNDKYPKNKLTKSNFAQIFQGFNKKLCYITTAICRNHQKTDNCYELSLLRQYRDGWLTSQPDGERLINQYYLFAPMIVQGIEKQPNRDEIYSVLEQTYLSECVRQIENREYEACKKTYIAMVLDMEQYL